MPKEENIFLDIAVLKVMIVFAVLATPTPQNISPPSLKGNSFKYDTGSANISFSFNIKTFGQKFYFYSR